MKNAENIAIPMGGGWGEEGGGGNDIKGNTYNKSLQHCVFLRLF